MRWSKDQNPVRVGNINCEIVDAFELWCRRLLRVPWTARRSNQSILKETSPGYSLEGLMLKLKLQYFGHLKQRTDSLEKTLMLGKIEGRRRRGWQRMRWLDGITNTMDMNLSNLQELVMDRKPGVLVCEVLKSQTRLNWTELKLRSQAAVIKMKGNGMKRKYIMQFCLNLASGRWRSEQKVTISLTKLWLWLREVFRNDNVWNPSSVTW